MLKIDLRPFCLNSS